MSLRFHQIAFALALAVAPLVPTSASAYTLWSPPRRWVDTPRTVTVDFRGLPSVSAPDPDHGVSAAVGAINAWNTGGINPVVGESGAVAYILGDGRSDLIFDDPLGICTGNCLAITFTSYDTGPTHACGSLQFAAIIDSDIAFNTAFDFTTVAESGCSVEVFLEAVVSHEIGHLFGLGHSTVSTAVMYSSVSACNNRPIGSDDLAGRSVLYSCGSPNTPPTVSLTGPASGSTYTEPATIALEAAASDSDGSVVRVDFYRGSTLLGTDTTSPYELTWSNATAGTYSLTAVATDNGGASATSSAVTVTVAPPWNLPPTVSLTSPVSGASYPQPATIALAATASDSDGSVVSVRFYRGSTLLGTAATSPYQFTWKKVKSGTHSLTAVATDNRGASTTSSAVTVTVRR